MRLDCSLRCSSELILSNQVPSYRSMLGHPIIVEDKGDRLSLSDKTPGVTRRNEGHDVLIRRGSKGLMITTAAAAFYLCLYGLLRSEVIVGKWLELHSSGKRGLTLFLSHLTFTGFGHHKV